MLEIDNYIPYTEHSTYTGGGKKDETRYAWSI